MQLNVSQHQLFLFCDYFTESREQISQKKVQMNVDKKYDVESFDAKLLHGLLYGHSSNCLNSQLGKM